MKTKTYLTDMTEEERIQRRRESARKWYNKHKDEPYWIQKWRNRCLEQKNKHTEPCVYMYREIETGKIAYIGSTKNIGRRKANRKYGTGVPFDKIYKENPDKFELFIIGKYESIDIAREEEVKYIQKLKPLYNRKHNH